MALVGLFAALPTMMSAVLDRGHEIPKLMLAVPLAMIALAAASADSGWRELRSLGMSAGIAVVALSAFILNACLSTVAAGAPASMIFGSFFRLEGLVAWLGYTAVFLGVLAWGRERGMVLALVDVILISSLIPALYALQQALGLDFYHVQGRDPTRANGTQGNPVQLAEYLAMLLPLTVARIWRSWGRAAHALPWCVILAAQFAALLTTQSRGSLAAGVAGLMLLAVLGAALTGRRVWFALPGLLLVAAPSALVLINLQPDARHWAMSVPIVNRMVIDLAPDSGAAPSPASRSMTARLGMWQAGLEAFAAAPLPRKLVGYGPESAHFYYLRHIPPSVIRSEDFRVTAGFDRLHADALDISANFGILGWGAYLAFFLAVMLVGSRALMGSFTGVSTGRYLTIAGCAGLSAIALAWILGFPSAAVPAGAVGIALGWMIVVGATSWRLAGGASLDSTHRVDRDVGILQAGLLAALLTFWVNAQVSIPLITSRMVFFGVAALLLAAARLPVAISDHQPQGAPNEAGVVRWWGLLIAAIAAAASFLPVVTTEATVANVPSLGLRVAPIGLLIVAGAWAIGADGRSGIAGRASAGAGLVAGAVVLFSLFQMAIRVKLDSGFGPGVAARVAGTVAVAPAVICCLCLPAGWLSARRGAGERPSLSAGRVAVIGACLLVGVWSVAGVWKALRADVSATSARWAVVREKAVIVRLIESAIALQPHEWQYLRMAIYQALGEALSELRPNGLLPDRYQYFRAAISRAEAAARDARKAAPDDPWPMVALANVLQVRALAMVRHHDPEGGQKAADEAGLLFSAAAQAFPVQPIIFRNWAQLKFDTGHVEEGFRLLDRMESIIPDEPDAYIERVVMARRFGHVQEESLALHRATRRLQGRALDSVRNVAK